MPRFSANGDGTIGDIIAQAIEEVGEDGVITIEQGKGFETEVEVVDGMQFDRGYLSPYFVTNAETMETMLEDCYVLCHEKKISSLKDLLPMLQKIAQAAKPLLIIAEDIEGEALAALVVNRLRGVLQVAAVKAPAFGDRRKEILNDIAIMTGGEYISEELGITLESIELSQLGRAKRIEITKDNTTIIEGGGKKKDINGRCEQIRRAIETTTSDYDREKLQERLAKLAGGVAVIRIGAATETELKEKKDRADDALNATRAAIEEGIVAGGAVALLRAIPKVEALQLEGDEAIGAKIVAKAMQAPLTQIAANAGVEGAVIVNDVREAKGNMGFNAAKGAMEDMVKGGIIDPAKVIRCALQNAVSAATMIVTTECLVTDIPEPEKPPMGPPGGGMGGMGAHGRHGRHGRHDVIRPHEPAFPARAGSGNRPARVFCAMPNDAVSSSSVLQAFQGMMAFWPRPGAEDLGDTQCDEAWYMQWRPAWPCCALAGCKPTVNFTVSNTEGLPPLDVTFTGDCKTLLLGSIDFSSIFPIKEQLWDFGDGGDTSEDLEAEHTYNDVGVYTVTLAASNVFGTTALVRTDLIEVAGTAPQAAFTMDLSTGTAPLDVDFTDTSTAGSQEITAWEWDFGDGSGSSSQNPEHTYSPGLLAGQSQKYTVSLTVQNALGSSTSVSEDCVEVTVDGPEANFIAEDHEGDAPFTAQFTDKSTEGSYDITAWEWDFGDGGQSTEQNPGHTYDLTGTYTVSLTVTTAAGASAFTRENYVTVTAGGPIARFKAEDTAGLAPFDASFKDLSFPGSSEITAYLWDFGDGGQSTVQHPVHTYQDRGVYSVSLMVTTDLGDDTVIEEDFIQIFSEPAAAFTDTAGAGNPLQVTFEDVSDLGGAARISREWDFGDGSTHTIENPIHTYASPDTYTVKLTITVDVDEAEDFVSELERQVVVSGAR